MTKEDFINMNLNFEYIIQKLPVYPKFTKEQMLSEIEYFHKFGDDAFANEMEQVVKDYPDAKIYIHFKRNYYPVSNVEDIANIPKLLDHLEWRIELDYYNDYEEHPKSN